MVETIGSGRRPEREPLRRVLSREAEPSCVSKAQIVFSEIEQAQVELRECIEHSRRLVERSDALIRRVKDRSAEAGAEASLPTQPQTAVTSPR
jgi:hypothetical protein